MPSFDPHAVWRTLQQQSERAHPGTSSTWDARHDERQSLRKSVAFLSPYAMLNLLITGILEHRDANLHHTLRMVVNESSMMHPPFFANMVHQGLDRRLPPFFWEALGTAIAPPHFEPLMFNATSHGLSGEDLAPFTQGLSHHAVRWLMSTPSLRKNETMDAEHMGMIERLNIGLSPSQRQSMLSDGRLLLGVTMPVLTTFLTHCNVEDVARALNHPSHDVVDRLVTAMPSTVLTTVRQRLTGCDGAAPSNVINALDKRITEQTPASRALFSEAEVLASVPAPILPSRKPSRPGR